MSEPQSPAVAEADLPHDMLRQLSQIADAAGRAILRVYARDFKVISKDDNSPLTEADLAANRIIVGGLARITPSIPVLSEEAANIPWATRRAWPMYWIVDPLDGTREFVNRSDEFTVNIALVVDGEPLWAVVAAPALGESFVAGTGSRGGAWHRQNGVWRRISTRAAPACPTVLASRSHRSKAINTVLGRLPAMDVISAGSSLKFCRIAQGLADVYPRLGLTSEWDTAAGQAVLQAAGGAVYALGDTPNAGQTLRYNAKANILNPHFIAMGRAQDAWLGRLGLA